MRTSIKIERPGVGDDTRSWGPPYLKDAEGRDTHEAAYFLGANRGKKSVTLDIAKPEGQAIARRLAARCDVLIENYKAGDLTRYGLGYEQLRWLNPGLIYCSITGFGQTGPMRNVAGYDFIIQAMGGLMSITGERDDLPGGGPQKVGVAVADITTGMYATVAILAALAHRAQTGEGQYIDMALLDVQVAMIANMNMNYLVTGRVAKAFWQRSREHRALSGVRRRGWTIRARGRQRRSVREVLRSGGLRISSRPALCEKCGSRAPSGRARAAAGGRAS